MALEAWRDEKQYQRLTIYKEYTMYNFRFWTLNDMWLELKTVSSKQDEHTSGPNNQFLDWKMES